MANNRMYIVCQGCEEFLKFDKYYPENPWRITPEKLEELNKFWENHHHKCAEKENKKRAYGNKMTGDEITKIVYEGDPILQKILKKHYENT